MTCHLSSGEHVEGSESEVMLSQYYVCRSQHHGTENEEAVTPGSCRHTHPTSCLLTLRLSVLWRGAWRP